MRDQYEKSEHNASKYQKHLDIKTFQHIHVWSMLTNSSKPFQISKPLLKDFINLVQCEQREQKPYKYQKHLDLNFNIFMFDQCQQSKQNLSFCWKDILT